MYGSNIGTNLTNGLSLSKVIKGLSKTLNVANQIIPLYKEVQPIIKNVTPLLSIFKEVNKDEPEEKVVENSSLDLKEPPPLIIEKKKELVTNSPTFFQ